jgi:hypothetical protein
MTPGEEDGVRSTTHMNRALVVAAMWAAAAPPAAAQELFDLQKVADGVYAALAKPRTPINSNGAVIVLDDGVLVVVGYAWLPCA